MDGLFWNNQDGNTHQKSGNSRDQGAKFLSKVTVHWTL